MDRKRRETQQKKKRKKPLLLAFILIIEISLMIYFTNYLGIIVIILNIIPILFVLSLLRSYSKGRKRTHVFSIILILLYLVPLLIMGRIHFSLLNITQGDVTTEFYVVTTVDNPVESIKELEEGQQVALQSAASYAGNEFPQKKFTKEGYDFVYTEYESPLASAIALYDGTEEYIVLPSLSDEQVLSYYPNFSKETKVLDSFTETEKVKTGNKKIKKEPFTVAVMGSDSREDTIDKNERSDTVMLFAVNPNTYEAQIVSLPRDAYIQDNSCQGGSYDKLTHVSLNGSDCMMSVLEDVLDVPVDYYIKINFTSVIDAIDVVGGIDVEVDQSFCGQDENDVDDAYCFYEGTQTLSGSEALSYARERKSFSNGDYARAYHQQQVAIEFAGAVASSGPSTINDLLVISGNSLKTNFSSSDLVSLTVMATEIDKYTIDSYVIDGSSSSANLPQWGLYGTSVQILSESSVAEANSKLTDVLDGTTE